MLCTNFFGKSKSFAEVGFLFFFILLNCNFIHIQMSSQNRCDRSAYQATDCTKQSRSQSQMQTSIFDSYDSFDFLKSKSPMRSRFASVRTSRWLSRFTNAVCRSPVSD